MIPFFFTDSNLKNVLYLEMTLCSMEIDALNVANVESFLFIIVKVLANKSYEKKQKGSRILHCKQECC